MIKIQVKFIFLIVAIMLFSVKGNAQTVETIEPAQIGIYEHLGDTIPNISFINNEDSSEVKLYDIIDRPTVFSFVYYNCPGICSPLLQGVSEVIERTDMTLGQEYKMITISFNPDDRPSLGIKKKKNFVASIKSKTIPEKEWIWLTGDSSSIAKITDAFGFKYIKQEDGQYAHTGAIMLVSPKGKITRYLYGTTYLPFDLKMAVTEAAEGKTSPTINKVLQYCFSYDQKGKKYVLNVTKISATIMIIGALTFFTILLIKGRRKDKVSDEII